MKSTGTVKEQVSETKGWWMSIRVGPMDRAEMQEGGRPALIEVSFPSR